MIAGMDWEQLRENLGGFFRGMAYGHYEQYVRAQVMQLNDLFMLLCYMEMVGLPNPASMYLLEVYPYFIEQFHLWHRRMGMEHSPLDNLPCC